MSDRTPTDPLFQDQWYLDNTGQFGGTPGVDIDVLPVWADYTGKGVRVAVVDDGTQLDHPDLAANIDLADSYDATLNKQGGNPLYPSENHGTNVAGIIAAQADNGIGGTGVAPDATLIIDRINLHDSPDSNDSAVSDDTRGAATRAFISALSAGADIISNSWGWSTGLVNAPGTPTSLASAETTAVTTGRAGKGSIILFAEGNYRATGNDGNLDNNDNGRFVMGVAATDNTGVVTSYSSRGANILVSAPSDKNDDTENPLVPGSGITSTDRTGTDGYNTTPGEAGDYNYDFGGTSAATPEVAGIVALMLQANPDLGYRDVQQILAYTARQTDPGSATWVGNGADTWNGGGLHFSTDYGFGLVDARAAVRLAEAYSALGSKPATEANLVTQTSRSLPSAPEVVDSTGVTATFEMEAGIFINHVDLNLGMIAADPSHIVVTLVSPDGTQIAMVSDPLNAKTAWPINFTVGTDAFWGEDSGKNGDIGTWTLKIVDNGDDPSGVFFTGASLSLEGGAVPQHLQFVYTDAYATTAAGSSGRQDLDYNGIADIDAAPVTGTVLVDLPGNTAFIDNTPLTITSGTAVGGVVTGDGNDTIIGDDKDHLYDAGRGTNTIVMGDGNDTVVSIGTDRIVAGAGSSTLQIRGSDSTVLGGGGQLTIDDTAAHGTSVTGGLGSMVIQAGSSGCYTLASAAVIDCSHGDADTISASGNTTVIGGASTAVSCLAAGSLQFTAAANASAQIESHTANTTVFGAAGSDVAFNGLGILAAGGGNETLNGAASGTGFACFASNTVTGATTELLGGTGSDVLVAGCGTQTLSGGTGGANTFILAANGTLGSASITISDFDAAHGNVVGLFGYGANEVATTLESAKTVNGSASITLMDGSKVTFLGVANLDVRQFVGG